jgi:hypothetical protein
MSFQNMCSISYLQDLDGLVRVVDIQISNVTIQVDSQQVTILPQATNLVEVGLLGELEGANESHMSEYNQIKLKTSWIEHT